MSLKSLLKKKAFSYSKNYIERIENCVLAYSQEGEDLFLSKIFGQKLNGFFIDVGAHHPKLYSNTYYFYKLGWRGINIDPLPGIMDLFNKQRPLDINLELGISEKAGELTYYMFDEPALNSFSKEVAMKRVEDKCKMIGEKKIATKRLDEVLDKYLPKEKSIDFLSIDVEGLDFQVLLSNNWGKYRPKVVLLECLNSTVDDIMKSEVFGLMKENKYLLFGKTVGTVFFVDSTQPVL